MYLLSPFPYILIQRQTEVENSLIIYQNMQPKKAKNFVKSLRELNAALSGLIKNIREDITYLEKTIASSRQTLQKPYLDKELKGNKLIEDLKKHIN